MLRPSGARLAAASLIAARGRLESLLEVDGTAFSALLVAAEADPALPGVSRADLALLLCVCLLTPCEMAAAERLRQATILAGLVGAVPGEVSPRLAVDCAIAYGCGWQRSGNPAEPPPAYWARAIQLLVAQVETAVKFANRRLGGRLAWLAKQEALAAMLTNLHESFPLSAQVLAFRLIRPLSQPARFPAGLFDVQTNVEGMDDDDIAATAPASDFAVVTGRLPLAAGARYLFEVENGFVLAEAHGRMLAAGPRGQIVVRAGDFGQRELWFPVAANLGRLHRLSRLDHGEIEGTPDGALLAWECGCGSYACAERHRLSSWRPDEKIGLKDFVYSAINGRHAKLTSNAFTAGMYYSYLVREGWSAAHSDSTEAPQPRLRMVQMIRRSERIPPAGGNAVVTEELAENLLVISSAGDFRPARVIRCPACRAYRQVAEAICGCGNAQMPGSSTVVWKPMVPWGAGVNPAGQDDPDSGLAEHLDEFLAGWRELLDDAERQPTEPGQPSELAAQRSTYVALVEAVAGSDWEAALDLIEYARERGWPLPEVSRV